MAEPICPDCGGPMWDNRAKKASGEFNKKGPDFTCKNKEDCGKVIWPPKGKERRNQPAQPVENYDDNGYSAWGMADNQEFQQRKPAGTPAAPVEQKVWDAKDLRISKLSTLSSAVNLLAPMIKEGQITYATPQQAAQDVVKIAEFFKQYTYGELDQDE